MNILIVDDSRAMRTIVIRTLRQAGFGDHIIREAVSGGDALAQIVGQQPDLVLSDWNFSDMTGLHLLAILAERRPAAKFGFVTHDADPHMRRRAMEAGAAFLIAKPFTTETFQQVLGPILRAKDADLYECAECSAKPGSPTLCNRCLAAREAAGDRWVGPKTETAQMEAGADELWLLIQPKKLLYIERYQVIRGRRRALEAAVAAGYPMKDPIVRAMGMSAVPGVANIYQSGDVHVEFTRVEVR